MRPPAGLAAEIRTYSDKCTYCFGDVDVDAGVLVYSTDKSCYFENIVKTGSESLTGDQAMEDMKQIIKSKAEKHSKYYRDMYAPGLDDEDLQHVQQMAGQVPEHADSTSEQDVEHVKPRQRRTGVFEMANLKESLPIFKSVKQLRENYLKKLEATSKKLQEEKKCEKKENIDDSFLLPPPSGYCSSTASAASDDEREKAWYHQHQRPQVRRSGSSDSAVGLTPSDDESFEKKDDNVQQKPFVSPYSPRGSVDHVNVPSKTLIEAQYVPCPLDRKLSDCGSENAENTADSRRHSCFTDDGEETPRCRYWRTPSVVVSDYSDDVMGLTLEDIEYFRNQRKENSSSPESSLNSSCSNLNYCGSTISNLDSEYVLRQPFRKSSDCSTCSTFSGDEEVENTLPLPASKDQVSEC